MPRRVPPPATEDRGADGQPDREAALQNAYEILAGPWRRQRNTLGAEFATSHQAILNERQLEEWPAIERSVRRQKSLRRDRFSGEGVDRRSATTSS
jgi:hypothetical protein